MNQIFEMYHITVLDILIFKQNNSIVAKIV